MSEFFDPSFLEKIGIRRDTEHREEARRDQLERQKHLQAEAAVQVYEGSLPELQIQAESSLYRTILPWWVEMEELGVLAALKPTLRSGPLKIHSTQPFFYPEYAYDFLEQRKGVVPMPSFDQYWNGKFWLLLEGKQPTLQYNFRGPAEANSWAGSMAMRQGKENLNPLNASHFLETVHPEAAVSFESAILESKVIRVIERALDRKQ